MTERVKRFFLRWIIIEALTIIIITVHFIITPAHRPYALTVYAILLLSVIALCIVWSIFKKRSKW